MLCVADSHQLVCCSLTVVLYDADSVSAVTVQYIISSTLAALYVVVIFLLFMSCLCSYFSRPVML